MEAERERKKKLLPYPAESKKPEKKYLQNKDIYYSCIFKLISLLKF